MAILTAKSESECDIFSSCFTHQRLIIAQLLADRLWASECHWSLWFKLEM